MAAQMNSGTSDHQVAIGVDSEIGDLKAVILHRPGKEVENMTPKNVERALYSDILNLAVVTPEYEQMQGVLQRVTRTFQIRDLLADILADETVKLQLVGDLCRHEGVSGLISALSGLEADELARQLIEGVVMQKDSLTKYLSKDYYALNPLHNFFYTRDAAVALPEGILIGKMANQVRERETRIMHAIFNHHPVLRAKTISVHAATDPDTTNLATCGAWDRVTIEGGDVLVAREDVLLIGIGARTTPQGVDIIIERLKQAKSRKHIVVQELPRNPESFIHLDMVFTFLDVDQCMVHEPIIIKPNRLETVHIVVDNGEVASIRTEANLLAVLDRIGLALSPVICGGIGDSWFQEREQWHSGANFFALGPGKVIGYARNVNTLEEMSRNGYEILKADAVINGQVDLANYPKYAVTIEGSELARGGGGCRCMTLPISRAPVAN